MDRRCKLILLFHYFKLTRTQYNVKEHHLTMNDKVNGVNEKKLRDLVDLTGFFAVIP